MNPHPLSGISALRGRDRRQQHLRRRHDRLARRLIGVGGVVVVGAMMLILLYLAWVVAPLFLGASASPQPLDARDDWTGDTPLLVLEERGDLGVRADGNGVLEAFRFPALETLESRPLPLGDGARVSVMATDLQRPGLVAAGTDGGRVLVFRQGFERLPGDPGTRRPVRFDIEYPFGDEARFFARDPIEHLALVDREDRLVVAALAGRRLAVESGAKRTDFLTGAVTLDSRLAHRDLDFDPTGLVVDGNQRWAYVSDGAGQVHRFTLPSLTPSGGVPVGTAAITAMAPLLGGVSLLVGDANGGIAQAFPVRDEAGEPRLEVIRRFDPLGAPIVALMSEQRRRGFIAVDAAGDLGLYHSTAGERLLTRPLPAGGGGPEEGAFAFAPRADQFLHLGPGGHLARLVIDNPHPEVNFSTLWRETWYEGYPEPQHVWQSTAANDDFEPKLSLAPLALGTLKASLYALLFAVPVALLGATYTAVFMAPALRRKVKPAIELMAALPTVILGFLAGLWLAPFIENHLAALFAMGVLLPLGLIAFSYAWSRSALRRRLPWTRGWEPLLLVPVIVGLGALALGIAPALEQAIFGGDLREWLNQEAGVSYDQRNAIVVGIAMGFSVIPIIFSIAEDALYAVPSSLSDGALALGATRWQTLVRIVLPTASPGIFSGLMIGLGRAVGETMIVLMATGNTPVMDWSPFEGMRTLAANIAIEMPESSVASTHFRVLFLSALVLFVFTFIVNTVAELVRQRLRDRYASL